MAVIKCSNCENEILDNEIVCPYCDCPLSETIKKMKQDDLKSFSDKSVDELTGKIPVIQEEPKIATSSDFEKEKAAILKDLELKFDTPKAPAEAEKEESDLGKTVKISREELLGTKAKTTSSAGVMVKGTSSSASDRTSRSSGTKKGSKKKSNSKYIILGITVLGIILIAFLISKITDSISDGINSRKKTNRTISVSSSAEVLTKEQGFLISSSSLTITDEKVMTEYDEAKDYPWYEHKDNIKHVTINDGITQIGTGAFVGYTNLTTVTLSDKVTYIGDYAFKGCTSLKKVVLSDTNGLVEIGTSAFEGCKNLENISGYTKKAKFEPLLAVIGEKAFAGCTAIEEFKLPDDIVLKEDVFKGHSKEFAIICSDSGNAYDYAKEYNIPIKEDFNMGIIEEDAKEPEEEPQEETEKNTSTKTETTESGEKNNKPNDTTNKETQTESAPQQTDSQKKIEELQKQLTSASPEEQEKILPEMEKYY